MLLTNLHWATIQRVAPDSEAVTAARGLLKKNSFLDPGISADQTR